MIICVGEILADLIGVEEDGVMTYKRHAGGAPFNVACGLQELGTPCGFCGKVGNDIIGDYLFSFAESQGFSFLDIEKDKLKNTTLAFVELDNRGERGFSFYRKNTADYAISEKTISAIASADIIHLGSLMLSEALGRKYADNLIHTVKEQGKKLSFDVNFREDVFESKNEAVKIYQKYIDAADIIKLSEEEIALFSNERTKEKQLLDIASGRKIVFLTLGSEGSMVCSEGKVYFEPATKCKCVDTTGAGDAFYAGVLSAIVSGELNWNTILRKGNLCGALTVAEMGAIGALKNAKIL